MARLNARVRVEWTCKKNCAMLLILSRFGLQECLVFITLAAVVADVIDGCALFNNSAMHRVDHAATFSPRLVSRNGFGGRASRHAR